MNGTWYTPEGHVVTMTYRDGTNDWNTISSVMTNDEYGFHSITGTAVDIGAHIGSATVCMLMDNPDLRVIAVEPIPENIALLRENLDQNGLRDRCVIQPGMVGTDKVEYGFTGPETATHHAWIGNATGLGGTATKTAKVPTVTMAELGPVTFIKIDCEGGEWGFLDDPDVPRIVGEWHPFGGYTQGDLLIRLPRHQVTFSGPVEGPGGFVAVLA